MVDNPRNDFKPTRDDSDGNKQVKHTDIASRIN